MRAHFTLWLLALFVFCCVAGTLTAAPITNVPVLKVDNAHWLSKRGAGSKSSPYRIKACASVILDATDYIFAPPEELKDKPLNSIRVIVSNDFIYESTWQPDKNCYELSAATLRPLGHSPPFLGFEKDCPYVIQIGVLEPSGKFFEVWVSIIEVH